MNKTGSIIVAAVITSFLAVSMGAGVAGYVKDQQPGQRYIVEAVAAAAHGPMLLFVAIGSFGYELLRMK